MSRDLYVRRIRAAVCSIFIVCILLAVRLYVLSTEDNTALEVLSGQYTRKAVAAQREGFVYDTNGNMLSHRENGAVVIVKPFMSSDRNTAIGYLSDFSGYDFDSVLEKYNRAVPFTLKFDSIPERTPPDGVYVYPSYSASDNSLCRHVLGFRNSDGKGMDGIYKIYGDLLEEYSGSLSYKYSANAKGGLLKDGSFYVEDKNYSGKGGIMLTIDAELQRRVDEICDEHMDMGAVIISELSTGNILALSSRPLYDSNDVASSLDSERGELINRAFSLYTPGSVFKAVVAASALEKDESLYAFEYECTGRCDVSGRIFKCHNEDGHGVQTMKEAFANSCNTYFIKLLSETGFGNTLAFCQRLGLGSPNAIDGFLIDGAKIPDMSKRYPDAYKANFAFGQGDLLLSCVDVLKIYCACVTGVSRDFSVVKGICEASENESIMFEPKNEERVISDETVRKMREMMRECVVNGTGKGAALKEVATGGKTATAQSGQYNKAGDEVLHKWFAGAFPIDEPEYAAVILCDGNGEACGNPKEIFALCAKSVLDCCDN